MADTKISALSQLAESPAATDELIVVDKSDTTMAASGTDKRITRADLLRGIDSAQHPIPSLVAPYPIPMATGGQAMPGTNGGRSCRVLIPKTGNLRDIAVFPTASSGNIEASIYSTAATRSRLWTSGSVACGAANAWQVVADPNLAVSAGDLLDLVIAADNTTAAFIRESTAGLAGLHNLPSGFAGGAAASPKIGCQITTAMPAPSTISEANMVAATTVPLIIARIS